MLELLYLVLIAPIEYGMEFVFENAVNWTGSYGLAIFILSFVVTLVVSPLYHIAEIWQNEERLTTNKFATEAAEIKEVFKGQERFMMLRTLYRQNNYHPIMAVKTSMGFLIQIPLFFAAFHFLGNYDDLEGQHFLIFENLSQPDAILSVAGLSINVMPLIMTIMNLASVFIYGSDLSRRDNIQLYVISAIFLILLYTSPVALVLYWTINNLFSLIRNIIYKKFNLLNKPALTGEHSLKVKKLPPPGQSVSEMSPIIIKISTSLTVLGNFIARFSPPNWGLYLIGAFASYNIWFYSILKSYFFQDQSNFHIGILAAFIIKASLILTMYLAVVLFGKFAHTFKFTKFNLVRLLVLFISACSLVVSTYSYSFAAFSTAEKLLVYDQMLYSIIILLLVLFVRIPIALAPYMKSTYNLFRDLPPRIYFAAVLLITAIIFIHSPVALLVTDLTILSASTLSGFLTDIFTFFFISTIIFAFIYIIFSVNYKGLLTFFVLCFAISAILYTYVFVNNLGAIDTFKLQDPSKLLKKINVVYDAIIFLLIFVGLRFVLKAGKTKELFSFLVIIHISLAAMTTISLLGIKNHPEKEKDGVSQFDNMLPDYNHDLLSYSKKGNNVVVLMLDMFSGDNIQPMLDTHPEFHAILDGFAWYSNTLSAGGATLQGEPGIHGGHYYTPHKVNTRKIDSLENEIARGYKIFSSSFGNKNYDVSFSGVTITSCENIKKHLEMPIKFCSDRSINHDYINYWLDNNKEIADWYQSNESSKVSEILPALGFFLASPYSVRRYIYGARSWMGAYDTYVNDLKISISRFAFLDSWSSISNTKSKKNTFKYIQTAFTHFPYALTSDCQLSDRKNVMVKKDSDEAYKQYRDHTTCAMRSLSKWLNWLKKNNIYDNTKIIIVSDHGYENNSIGFWRAHALMLVKDFNSFGPLVVKDTFLSNADTPSIACSAIGGCEHIIPDPTKHFIADRSLFITYGPSNILANPENKYNVHKQYEVKKSIFNPENWKISK